MVDFNGFDNGVIGKKLPSDATLNNMRKADLIELLHLAESNHRVLAETYKIAIDTSKCNHCPLSIDTRRAKQIRAEVIEECAKVVSSMVGICQSSCPIDCQWGTEESCVESWKIYLAEQLKEHSNERMDL